jgi:hypothetical protein
MQKTHSVPSKFALQPRTWHVPSRDASTKKGLPKAEGKEKRKMRAFAVTLLALYLTDAKTNGAQVSDPSIGTAIKSPAPRPGSFISDSLSNYFAGVIFAT